MELAPLFAVRVPPVVPLFVLPDCRVRVPALPDALEPTLTEMEPVLPPLLPSKVGESPVPMKMDPLVPRLFAAVPVPI